MTSDQAIVAVDHLLSLGLPIETDDLDVLAQALRLAVPCRSATDQPSRGYGYGYGYGYGDDDGDGDGYGGES
jgi:hypothetical protein